MSIPDTDSAVLGALKNSLTDVSMRRPVEQIITAGRARRRHRIIGASAGVAAVTGLALGVPALSQSPSQPLAPSSGSSEVHIHTVAFTVDSQTNGTVRVVWDKQRYADGREGLQKALRQAGFPVLMKEGVFCKGANDDGALSPAGEGPGVSQVMTAEPASGKPGTKTDDVVIIFKPSAMPAGKQLFIGYLSPAQLAITHGAPGSVERLVPVGEPLTCTTQAPPPHLRDGHAAAPSS